MLILSVIPNRQPVHTLFVFPVVVYLNLPLHGDAKQHDEVHYEYWPEHWNIEGIEKRANHGDDDAFCCRVPVTKIRGREDFCKFLNVKFSNF